MREFVYVSERKLTQFAPERTSFWKRLRLHKLSGSVGVAQTKVDFEAQPVSTTSHDTLRRVTEHLEYAAMWYGDERAVTGTWVFFDALLYQTIVRLNAHDTSAAVFFDIDDDRPGTSAGRRLFLHGAAEHLLGGPAVSLEHTRPSRPGPARPDPVRTDGPVPSWGLTAATWEDVAFGLGYRDTPTVETPGQTDLRDMQIVRDVLDWMFTSLAANEYCRSLASWMTGCARVTSIVTMGTYDVMTASPLYVERVPPPTND